MTKVRSCLFGGALFAAGVSGGQPLAFSVGGTFEASGTPAYNYAQPFAASFYSDAVITPRRYTFSVAAESQVVMDVFSYGQFPTFVDADLILFEDNGQPLGNDTFIERGTNRAVGNDLNGSTSTRDAFIDRVLPAGEYILVVGPGLLSVGEAVNDAADGGIFAQAGTPTPIFSGQFRVDIYGESVVNTSGPFVTNVTQGVEYPSIQQAVDASSPGDTLQLAEGVYSERSISLSDKDVVIHGQGPDATFIDGGGMAGNVFVINGGDRSVIESLSIINGVADGGNGGGAAEIRNSGTRTVFRDVHFVGNDAGGATYSTLNVESATVTVERCVFRDNVARTSSNRAHLGGINSQLVILNSLFYNNVNGVEVIRPTSSNASLVVANCTFADNPDATLSVSSATAPTEIYNCVSDITLFGGTVEGMGGNVYVGATGSDIDAEPVFVDALNGDFRLDASSPGIDAGDYTRYLDAGGDPLADLVGTTRLVDVTTVANTSTPFYFPIDSGALETIPTEDAEPACPADQNFDGILNGADFNAWLTNFQAGCP